MSCSELYNHLKFIVKVAFLFQVNLCDVVLKSDKSTTFSYKIFQKHPLFLIIEYLYRNGCLIIFQWNCQPTGMRIPSQIDLFIKVTLQSIDNFLMALNSIRDCLVKRFSFAPNDTGGMCNGFVN